MGKKLIMSSKVKNDLFDYPNRYIMQLDGGFKFSLDSILLSEFANIKKSDKLILDMCTGNAVVPLVLSLKSDALIKGFEIQEEISNLAKESVEINNLGNKIEIINDDVKNIDNYYNKNSFDVITCNPPFFKVSNLMNEVDYLKIARHEVSITLEDVFSIASKYLKVGGSFFLVHRVSRIDEVFYYAKVYDINVKEMALVSTKVGKTPSILLVKCVKKSKEGVVLSNVVCVDNLSTYQHLFRR